MRLKVKYPVLLTSLATIAFLNAVENEILSISNLVKKKLTITQKVKKLKKKNYRP